MSSLITFVPENIEDGININYAICGVLGLILNSTVLAVLVDKLKNKRTHTDIKICTFVASADILASLGLIFRSIIVKFPYNLLKAHPIWCKLDVFIAQDINCSGYTLAVMSLERFLLICFNIELPIWIWLISLFAIFSLIYSITIVCAVADLVGLTSTGVTCTLIATGVCYYSFLITTIIFLFSFMMVLVSYFGIVAFKIKHCVNQINLNIPKERVYSELRSTLIKSFINILLYIFVFIFKIYGLVYVSITGRKRSMTVEVITQLTISYTCVVNALILLYMNHEVRISFFDLLKRIKNRIFPNRNLINY
jgi:hypothetical protein